MKIVYCLWEVGADEAHEEYPSISANQFRVANEYYNSLRCPGCMCGSCVNLPALASSLEHSPEDLKPIAKLAIILGKEELEQNP